MASDQQAAAGTVVAVSRNGTHSFGKSTQQGVRLLAGLGVEGDAHAGTTVQHGTRAERESNKPNLRQVHLIHSELHAELARQGIRVLPGQMGENITTSGIDLLGLPTGARLRLGDEAVIEVTGLRAPCKKLDRLADGLMAALISRTDDGTVIVKSGVMGVVITGGEVRPSDPISVQLPAAPRQQLQEV